MILWFSKKKPNHNWTFLLFHYQNSLLPIHSWHLHKLPSFQQTLHLIGFLAGHQPIWFKRKIKIPLSILKRVFKKLKAIIKTCSDLVRMEIQTVLICLGSFWMKDKANLNKLKKLREKLYSIKILLKLRSPKRIMKINKLR